MMIVLVVVSLFLCNIVQSAADVTAVLEPATQHSFESSLHNGRKKLTLAGVGVRVKQIGPIKAKVYSAAVYLDKGSVETKCKGLKCISEKELLNSKEFESTVVDGSGDNNIVLRMARSVRAEAMVDAVERSVRPRMNGKDSGALERFSSILLDGMKNGGAKNNMVLNFENCGNSKMTVSIDGKKKGTVQSPALCQAFSNVYLGADAVSPPLKTQVAKTLMGWKGVAAPRTDLLKTVVKIEVVGFGKLDNLKDVANKKADTLKAEAKQKSDKLKKEADEKAEKLKTEAKQKAATLKKESEDKAAKLKAEGKKTVSTWTTEAKPQLDSLKNAAKQKSDKLKKEADEKAEKLKTEAKQKAATLKKESEQKAEKLKTEGKQKIQGWTTEAKPQIDSLKNAAKQKADKLKKEADEKAEKLKTEAKQKAEALKKETKNKADKLKTEAKQKVDNLKTENKPKFEWFKSLTTTTKTETKK